MFGAPFSFAPLSGEQLREMMSAGQPMPAPLAPTSTAPSSTDTAPRPLLFASPGAAALLNAHFFTGAPQAVPPGLAALAQQPQQMQQPPPKRAKKAAAAAAATAAASAPATTTMMTTPRAATPLLADTDEEDTAAATASSSETLSSSTLVARALAPEFERLQQELSAHAERARAAANKAARKRLAEHLVQRGALRATDVGGGGSIRVSDVLARVRVDALTATTLTPTATSASEQQRQRNLLDRAQALSFCDNGACFGCVCVRTNIAGGGGGGGDLGGGGGCDNNNSSDASSSAPLLQCTCLLCGHDVLIPASPPLRDTERALLAVFRDFFRRRSLARADDHVAFRLHAAQQGRRLESRGAPSSAYEHELHERLGTLKRLANRLAATHGVYDCVACDGFVFATDGTVWGQCRTCGHKRQWREGGSALRVSNGARKRRRRYLRFVAQQGALLFSELDTVAAFRRHEDQDD